MNTFRKSACLILLISIITCLVSCGTKPDTTETTTGEKRYGQLLTIPETSTTSPDDISQYLDYDGIPSLRISKICAVNKKTHDVLLISDELYCEDIEGIYICEYLDDSPLKTKITTGWVITAVNGERVKTINKFHKLVDNLKEGDTVKFDYACLYVLQDKYEMKSLEITL